MQPKPPREYDLLPGPVRIQVSAKEYAWMSPEQRARLVEDFTEPPAEPLED